MINSPQKRKYSYLSFACVFNLICSVKKWETLLFLNYFLFRLLAQNSKIEFFYHFHRSKTIAKMKIKIKIKCFKSEIYLLDLVSYTLPKLIDFLRGLELFQQLKLNQAKLFEANHSEIILFSKNKNTLYFEVYLLYSRLKLNDHQVKTYNKEHNHRVLFESIHNYV